MQTFLAYLDFGESARCLDNRRLGKQRIECLQILNALKLGPYQCYSRFLFDNTSLKPATKEEYLDYLKGEGNFSFGYIYRKTPWYNHPAVQMWKNNTLALIAYGFIICQEWRVRGFKDTLLDKFRAETPLDLVPGFQYAKDCPDWLGNKEFHLSHKSNLIRKNPLHYRPIFGDGIPDNLPYYWPTKQLTS